MNEPAARASYAGYDAAWPRVAAATLREQRGRHRRRGRGEIATSIKPGRQRCGFGPSAGLIFDQLPAGGAVPPMGQATLGRRMLEIAIMVEGQSGLNWPRWQALAGAVEDLGFAALYRSDHLINAQLPDQDSLEAWTSLTWLASHTRRIEFGTLVSPHT
jgi:hypothetical protein